MKEENTKFWDVKKLEEEEEFAIRKMSPHGRNHKNKSCNLSGTWSSQIEERVIDLLRVEWKKVVIPGLKNVVLY